MKEGVRSAHPLSFIIQENDVIVQLQCMVRNDEVGGELSQEEEGSAAVAGISV